MIPPSQTDKNLYFGDLHVHSDLSFDSYLFGNRNTLDQAYAFARGQALTTLAGDCAASVAKLGIPLWEFVKAKAEEYNDPGRFTAFAAYEYSPPLDAHGKLHRNVFFRNQKTSKRAYSAFDAATAPILWKML